MKISLNRVILIQSNDELAHYTTSLLDKIGFRHIHRASSTTEALSLFKKFDEKRDPIDLVVVDDSIDGGALSLKATLKELNTLVITKESSPNNLSLYANFNMKKIIFLPYGGKQIEKSMLMSQY
jgi:hypothetical protein